MSNAFQGDVLAEETHSGRVWSLIILVALICPAIGVALVLGFRLRSISKQSIVSYSIESWTLMRGYGIRGVGNTRAYVWGNKVVHIKTSNGDIFLGHSDPQCIVRDLDLVTRG